MISLKGVTANSEVTFAGSRTARIETMLTRVWKCTSPRTDGHVISACIGTSVKAGIRGP